MAKNLVIVESPAKAKTIKKFLGTTYKIEASMGHVRDLPKSQMGIDVEHDFEPRYITIRGKGELLAKLRKEVKKAGKIYLATDPDREGEAISWHLLHALKLENATDKKVYRITFNEITKQAVTSSIASAREIDMDLVDAQQARRLLDRIVGYKISPLLWKKVKKGLSAGRVQSVALKLICDREKEIADFTPEEYWSIEAHLKDKKTKDSFVASFAGTKEQRFRPGNEEEVAKIVAAIEKETFKVSEIKESQRQRKPHFPFTTSTMQQEASKHLNFSAIKTMRIAQQLYEGIDVAGHGTVGLITYLRTDSTRISEEAHGLALDFIKEQYGEGYGNPENKSGKTKSGVQDAHEAIRPSYVTLIPIEIKASLSRDQYRLYDLIWKRFVSSRMMPALYDLKQVKIDAGEYLFKAALSIMKYDGFLKVYNIDEEEQDNQKIGKLSQDAEFKLEELDKKQHFTQHPPRYTEASLVKALEENGVGRPSTYAPTIATITSRGYVFKDGRQLFPTEMGEIVDGILHAYFDEVVNMSFTASMEEKLDSVEVGDIEWKEVLRDFYPKFDETVKKAEVQLEKVEIKDEESDVACEKCGRMMVIKLGKYGKFLACPGFPACQNAKPIFEKVEGVVCPKCSGDIMIKKTKKGRRYYGCEHNPECDFMTWDRPTAVKCEKCQSLMLEKGKKLLCSNEQCQHVVENNRIVE